MQLPNIFRDAAAGLGLHFLHMSESPFSHDAGHIDITIFFIMPTLSTKPYGVTTHLNGFDDQIMECDKEITKGGKTV